MKKVCHVIFSTNRIDYLKTTLESQKNNLNFDGLEVHKLFIDDYPLGRDNYLIGTLAKSYGFTEIFLHNENLGLTSTWHELFINLKDRNYDYILHQEDDVIFKERVNVAEWISFLEAHPHLSQLQLKRNNWYPDETDELTILPTDISVADGKYHIETSSSWFWMLAAIYPAWITKIDFVKETGFCPAEYVIADYLLEKYKLSTGILKSSTGENIVEHIGEVSTGKRVNPNEPGWDGFKSFDPTKKYYSRTGKLVDE